ncbi:leucine-rich repeat and guanylate kinase domain-containing protein isoform X5 [Canis lupus familiaris]|uniref:Leucine rich repeats and guanylate kinase domain containing n=1 Tax=Canis lupus familiaris TaxID=9615 RepID=A0A8P0S7E7_CANLF|nr:leucine-rich repeat and guanylate kinase domain-containing protein isoform X5 [Canis lupus familiaris]XP_038412393.1 leucine-rich repeat and guanylate kinase domain-containing protein isoform X5 [Canis lupus familiaris]
MAAAGSDPPGPRPSSLQSRARAGGRSTLLRSEKERQSCRSSFPMGQRPEGTLHKASSYLLQQLIHRSRESDAGGEEYGDDCEGEAESEESSESEMLNLEEEFDGVLREEVVANALHQLGRSGSGTEQVYLNLVLSNCDLIDISILCEYVHLQKLDLSVNKIEDLSCVSYMPYLLELNASHNKLTTFFNFKPPKNLKKVDFSYNQISEMRDLSAYQALTKLILDNNEIEEISGLELCSGLTHLSLAKNRITTINGLGILPIKILCLSNNQIEKITGLEDLKALQIVDLSHNQISSLQGLENHDFLEVINLEDNKIAELGEIEYIENLPLLRVLNFLRNPIQEKAEYWFFVIFMLLRLTELDQKKIKVEEKVAAVNRYDPPPEVVAAQDHLTHVVNSVMQPQRIFDSTLPRLDAPYPMLVLAGPEACGKRELAHRLCRQFSTYFRYGACHTTRPPYFGEGDRVDYHFISQEVFDEMLNMGKFILTFTYGRHNYGLNRDTIEGIARDGLASCIHMEIEGVRSLKCSYFEPRYILVVPTDKEKYEGYLRRKGLFSRVEIEFAVSRVDLYIKINQKFPGYFDAIINADDLEVAYQKLSQLIREYLGLSEETSKNLAPTADIKIPQLKSEEPSRKLTTWTLCDLLESTDRNYFVKLWAKLAAKKTPVERDSLERQYETARQALMGKIPPHHTLLFQRGPVPAPIINGLHYFTSLELQKSFELSEDYFKTLIGPYSEKSGKDPCIVKSFSTIFHSYPWSKEMSFQPPEGSIYSHPGSGVSESEAEQTLTELCKLSHPCDKGTVQHRRHTISVISHPGFNTKLTLPPIPQGHK